MKYKVVIWGIGKDYEKNRNMLSFEEYKGNLEIVAMVSRDKYANCLDQHKIINKCELEEFEYDYVIAFSRMYFADIVEEAVQMGIKRNKVINGKVFEIPYFDFGKYVSLIENPISIVSNDCWGGYINISIRIANDLSFLQLWA